MIFDISKTWSEVVESQETNYKIQTYHKLNEIKNSDVKNFDVFIIQCNPSDITKIKISELNLYRLKVKQFNWILKKSNKYKVVFDCNFTSIFLVNNAPFNQDSIFLKKVNRNCFFKQTCIKWKSKPDKCKFNTINYGDKLTPLQVSIIELIEKSPCTLLNIGKLYNLFINSSKIEEQTRQILISKIKDICPDFTIKSLDIDSKIDKLQYLVIPQHQLRILYKVDIKLDDRIIEYEDILKTIKKNAKMIPLNDNDTHLKCFKCKKQVPFSIIFGVKYDICKFCHLGNLKGLNIRDNREKIIEYESRLLKIGLDRKDIFKIRVNNSYT